MITISDIKSSYRENPIDLLIYNINNNIYIQKDIGMKVIRKIAFWYRKKRLYLIII